MSADKKKRTARTGIGARIYAAVGLVVVLTVVAAATASWSFVRVGEIIRSLVDEKLYVVQTSLELAQVATTAVAIAPKLAETRSDQERAAVLTQLQAADQRIRHFVDELAKRSAVERDGFHALVDGLASEIKQADDASRERIAIEAEKAKRVESLAKAQDTFNQLLVATVDGAQFDLMMGLERLGQGGDGAEIKDKIKTLSNRELSLYGGGMALLAEVNQLAGVLREVAAINRRESLVPARERFQAISQRASRALRDMDKASGSAKARAAAEAMVAFGTGNDSLFALRERDFANLDRLNRSLKGVGEAASALGAEIEGTVRQARNAAQYTSRSTYDLIATNQWWLGGIGLASILAALAIAVFYIRPRIVGRLTKLWASTRAIADGALDSEVDARGTDEISEIARAVLVFRDNARERERLAADRVQHAEAEARRAEAVNATVAGFEASVATVLKELRGASARLETASSSLNNSADAVSSEASDAEERVSESSNHVTTAAGSTEELAGSISEIAAQAAKSTDVAARAVAQAQRTGKTMEELAAAATRIGEVIGMIQAIAAQTNLLALNATIEAARAGDAGRGFAVVAQEVKTLAGQTGKATEEVAAQIGAIQSAAGDAASALAEVNAIIEEMSRMAGSVAAAMTQQNTAVSMIAEGVGRASAEAMSGAEAMSRVGRASAEARTTAGDVKTLAATLASEAERLDGEVRRFLDEVRAA